MRPTVRSARHSLVARTSRHDEGHREKLLDTSCRPKKRELRAKAARRAGCILAATDRNGARPGDLPGRTPLTIVPRVSVAKVGCFHAFFCGSDGATRLVHLALATALAHPVLSAFEMPANRQYGTLGMPAARNVSGGVKPPSSVNF